MNDRKKNYENVNKPCFFVSLYNTFYILTRDKYNYVEATKKCFIAVIGYFRVFFINFFLKK